MKVIVFGSNGMLAKDLIKEFQDHQIKVVPITRKQCDISNKSMVLQTIQSESDVDFIINCTAYTQVDLAETNYDQARVINSDAVSFLIDASIVTSIPLVHFSTDYVFDGKKLSQPYTENDTCNPINAYGYSKWLGEQQFQKNNLSYYIFRVQWLYAHQGHNFINSMKPLMQEKQELSIVSDQWGSPTYTANLASYVRQVLMLKPEYGLYHCTDHGYTTWYEFAKEIADYVGYEGVIKPISSELFARPAKRPKNGRLNCAKLETLATIKRQDWKESLKNFFNNES